MLKNIGADFHKVYEKQYGHSTPDGPSEFINLNISNSYDLQSLDISRIDHILNSFKS